MELLRATLTTYVTQYFIIVLVWSVAAILSLSHWRQHPKVSRLTLTAILIFFAESLASVFAYSYLPFMLRDAGWEHGTPPFSYIFFSLASLISPMMLAMAWSFIIAVIFSNRDKP